MVIHYVRILSPSPSLHLALRAPKLELAFPVKAIPGRETLWHLCSLRRFAIANTTIPHTSCRVTNRVVICLNEQWIPTKFDVKLTISHKYELIQNLWSSDFQILLKVYFSRTRMYIFTWSHFLGPKITTDPGHLYSSTFKEGGHKKQKWNYFAVKQKRKL